MPFKAVEEREKILACGGFIKVERFGGYDY